MTKPQNEGVAESQESLIVSFAEELNNVFHGFVLTRDNMIKLVDVAERLRAQLPCILMGEAGCGKTAA